MPLGFLSTGNVLSNSDASTGKKPSEMPGDGGVVAAFTLIASAEGLVPGTGTITVTPSEGAFASGADGSGNISVQVTWINSGDDVNWLLVGGGSHSFPDGFWNTLCRSTLSQANNTIGFDIQFSNNDVLGFTQDLVGGPGPNDFHDPSWDGDKGQVVLDIHYDHVPVENPTSIAILRNGAVVANIPVTGAVDYTYTDTVFSPGTIHYSFLIYKYPNSRGPESSSFSVTFGGVPTFEFTADGGFDMGGGALFGFLVDPSGIYTLTPNKTHDTIYNNTAAGNTTIDVPIP